MIKNLIILTMISMIAGCATGYRCNLGEECTDSLDALEAAKEDGGNSETVLVENHEYREFDDDEVESDSSTPGEGYLTVYGGNNLNTRPVYIPDSPIRIWIAAETDKNNDVLIGNYEMFTTVKGGYSINNYSKASRNNGTIDAGYIEPLNEKKNLGFNPEFNNANSIKPKSIFN